MQAGTYPDGENRRFCPTLEQPPVRRTVFSSEGIEERLFGRQFIKPIVFDRSSDAAAALALPNTTSSRSRATRKRIEKTCPKDPIQLMRTEVAPLCKESYVATGQTAPYTTVEMAPPQSVGLDPSQRAPQLIVRDEYGNPIAGKRCVIEDVGEGPAFFGLLELTPFGLNYECGPSDANGIITIRNLTFHGSSSRRLALRISVDGVPAQHDSSRWRFDTQVFYVATDMVPPLKS